MALNKSICIHHLNILCKISIFLCRKWSIHGPSLLCWPPFSFHISTPFGMKNLGSSTWIYRFHPSLICPRSGHFREQQAWNPKAVASYAGALISTFNSKFVFSSIKNSLNVFHGEWLDCDNPLAFCFSLSLSLDYCLLVVISIILTDRWPFLT